MGERKEYLRREEISQDWLAGILEGTNVPHREVLDFVERQTHDANSQMKKGAIMRRVRMASKDKTGSIVGFASRSVALKSGQVRETMIEPFHMKNKVMFELGDPGYELGSDDQPTVGEAYLVEATDELEHARLNLMCEAFIAMCNESAFVYMDGDDEDKSDIVISIDYSNDITTLEAAGSHSGSNGAFDAPDTVKTLFEVRKMKAEYRKADGIDFPPTVAFINANTQATLLSVPDILAKYKPLSSSDPDGIPSTYEGFEYDGIKFIVWHKDYQKSGDGAQPAVADGVAIVTVEEDPTTRSKPLVWHSAENTLNRNDASGARFEALQEGDEEPDLGVKMYDNGVPAPSRRNIVRRWQMF